MLVIRLFVLGVALAGCGYRSQYAPPNDGRARVLWHDDNVPSISRTDDCHRATWWLRHPGERSGEAATGLSVGLRLAPMVWVPRC